LVFALTARLASAKPTRFDMRDVGGRNLVAFTSDAPLEKTIGLSSFVSGWMELDPDKIDVKNPEAVKGEWEVDVRTFQTGAEAKSDQFRDKVMAAAEYPTASLSITKLLGASKSVLHDTRPVSIRVEALLKARGQSVPLALSFKVTHFKESALTRQRLPGSLLKISTVFDLDSASFGIIPPENARARYARYVQVTLDAVGTDKAPNLTPPSPSPSPASPEAPPEPSPKPAK
jgi:hypothetical protein